MDSIEQFQKPLLDRLLSGRYSIVRQLGAGGFSQTFLAKDTQLPGQPFCVVKQLKPQSKNMARWQVAKRLFDMEAAVLYRLGNHDRIPRLLAHFEDNQEFFLVQEFIEGEPLDNSRLPQWTEGQTLRRLQEILEVLAFVHQQQVIHRDIKPSNLIRRCQDDKLVLIDFGAVKQVSHPLDDSPFEQALTISIGTHGYMPPEQVSGNPRYNSDLYAVGIIGIQALTGVRPNQLQRDLQTGEILWHRLSPWVSPALAEILDRMVRYHFRDRYQTVGEPLQAIEQLIEERSQRGDEQLEEIKDSATVTFYPLGQEADALQHSFPAEAIASLPAVPFVAAAEPFITTAETAAEAVNPAEPVSFPDQILEEPSDSQHVLPLEALPDRASTSLPVPPTLALAPRTSTGFRISPWALLLPAGGVIAAAIALSNSLIPARLQSTMPAEKTAQPVQAPLLPDLPCREPPPPPLPSGKPSYEYADGTRYYGRMDGNRPADGRGTMTFPTGNRYDGEFRNGRREGCGTYSFANGRRYIGQFKADRFEGLGIWLLGNGDRYVGAFEGNRCHGEGIFLFSDGRSQRGTWQNGELVNGDLSCNR